MPRGNRTTARSILTLLLLGLLAGTASAAPPRQIIFPVVGPVTYSDDFGAPRSGHSHQGNDLMANRGSPVVAVEAGRVERPSWSSSDCALILHGRSGTEYWYLHLNNDVTRRDDNRARTCRNGVAFAPDFRSGSRVRAGQLIGYVGNSGNAAGGSPHLHFELHPSGRSAVSPYRWLRSAPRLLFAAPESRSVRLALHGKLRQAGDILAIQVNRLAVSRGWRGLPATRHVSLSLAPDAVVERRTKAGALAAAALAAGVPGELVSVWTTWFRPTLARQLAGGNVLAAQLVRLRGTAR